MKRSWIRNYLRLHLYLKKRGELLTMRQRKWIIYSLFIAYLIATASMIVLLFMGKAASSKEVLEEVKKSIYLDSPIKEVDNVDKRQQTIGAILA